MGASKKKAKFIAKGHLAQKLKQRNEKKKFQAMKDRKKNRFERNSDAPTKKKPVNEAAIAMHGAPGKKKEDADMLDDMDVDDFLNADFLDSDDNASDFGDDDSGARSGSKDDDDDMDGGSSSEEEDEDALDPRYMTTSLPPLEDDDDEEEGGKAGSDGDDGDDANDGADVPADDDEPQSVGRTTLSMEQLIKAEKEAFEKQTINGLRRMLKIFSDACRSSDAADVNKEGEIMYEIQSSAVYNRLMLSVFRKTHVAFARLVAQTAGSAAAANDDDDDDGGESNAAAKLKIDERKWKKHALLIRRFFSCACYLLEQTTGQDVQLFVLRELAHYVPFVTPCPKTARRLLKALLKLWAKSLNNSVCMLAFVRIRDLALQMPFPFLELALKGLYITYMRNTKFTNEATLPHHVLLGNCVVELYGLDLSSSYQHAFIYIRQLAIAIRKTITSPSPETFKAVLNWQFFNQLRVWTAVVCAYPGETQLQPLVYPLCQLLFALVRLSSTIRYAPLRFQCVKLLQQIAFATGAFVPTSPVLLEVLQMAPFSTSYRGNSKLKVAKESKGHLDLDLDLCVKLAKSNVESKRVHDLVIAKLFDLLQRECDVYKFHIGFPEFAVPLVLTLKKFVETCRIPKWASLARGIVDSLTKRADWIRVKRNGVDVAPKDIEQLDAFLKSEREAAVKKAFASDVEELQKKIATTSSGSQPSGDDDDDSDNDSTNGEEPAAAPVKIGKKKQRKLDAIAGRRAGGSDTVDDETFAKVKKMSLHEFKKAVAEVDEDDKVEDFAFSDDE